MSKQQKGTVTEEQVRKALAGIIDPDLGRDIVSLGFVKEITIDGAKVAVTIELTTPACPVKDEMKADAERLVGALGVDEVSVTMTAQVVGDRSAKKSAVLPGVGNTIAIASGKGGVGKSTVSSNLAVALARAGRRVGLLDADIYGPSQPRMLGITGTPESKDGTTLEPMENHNLKAMSIGFLVEEDTPMIWRGPMVTQALEQLLKDTNWGELDYLVVDLPPGTGDTQLTLSQKIPVSGAVIVTTPQDIALLDARKGLAMFEKVEVPVLGVVENMSIHICSQCGNAEHIFGQGGGEKMSKEYDVDFLGSLPLDINIREQADNGNPTVVADPDGQVSDMYRDISRKMSARLAEKSKDYSSKFPNIVIQNT